MNHQFLFCIFTKKRREKKTNWKIYMHHMLMAALFIIANIWKQPICPLMTMGKKCVIHTHTMEYYSAIKKRMKSCHLWQQWWTSGHYAKRNKPDRVKYHMISLVCGNQKRSLLIQRTDWWLPEDRHRRNRWTESGGKNNKIIRFKNKQNNVFNFKMKTKF